MNLVIRILIESTIILSVFYAIYSVFFVNDNDFKFTRIYLISSSLLAVIIPQLNIPILQATPTTGLNPVMIHDMVQLPEILISGSNESITSIGFPLSTVNLLLFIYLAGVLFFLVKFLYETGALLLFIYRNRDNIEQRSFYKVIYTGGRIPTSSFFNYLFWNETVKLNPTEKEQIIHHEEGHIRQFHSLDIIYLEFLKIIFWFNPLVHSYRKAISTVHEYLADEYVMKKNNSRNYPGLLARQVLQSCTISLSNHFSKSRTVKRIKMLKSGSRKPALLRWGLSIMAIGLMFYFFACETSDELQSSQPGAATNMEKEILSEDNDDVFSTVDRKPVPQGGMEDFYRFVQKNLKYPEEARKEGKEGRVFVEFIVRKNGKIDEVKVIKGFHQPCDEEARSVIQSSQDWVPGYLDGNAVDVKMILPVTFKLGNDEKI